MWIKTERYQELIANETRIKTNFEIAKQANKELHTKLGVELTVVNTLQKDTFELQKKIEVQTKELNETKSQLITKTQELEAKTKELETKTQELENLKEFAIIYNKTRSKADDQLYGTLEGQQGLVESQFKDLVSENKGMQELIDAGLFPEINKKLEQDKNKAQFTKAPKLGGN